MFAWLFVSLIVGSFGIGYLLSRYFLGRANLKPSYKGLLVGGLSGASVVFLYFVFKQFGINLFRGTPIRVFQFSLAVMFLIIPARMMFIRTRSGPELVNLGPSPLRMMFLVLGALMISLGAGGLFAQWTSTAQATVNLAQGIMLLTLGLIHSHIHTGGISYGGGLLPWARIASYEWSNGVTLVLDLHRPRWWQDRVQVPVPPALVDKVDQLMRQHVPAKA